MTLSRQQPKVNIYIRKPFPEIIRAWLLNDKNFTDITLTYIEDKAVGLFMAYGLVEDTVSKLKGYGLKDAKDFIVI
tara:strand:- start:277 stop:504 length:228 start_codon:yes stop_codon:yes gene_type:complete